MKSKIITGLKKEVLVIEAKSKDIAWGFMFNKYGLIELLKWELLGKPDEIKEEDVENLVRSWEPLDSKVLVYNNYNEGGVEFKTALKSFFSAIEKEIYWVNPIGNRIATPNGFHLPTFNKEFEKAQEKTFDRNRTLIFVKN